MRPTIKKVNVDAQVCDECTYRVQVAMEFIAPGSIHCINCKNEDVFAAYGPSSSILFTRVGVDAVGNAIYIPIKSNKGVTLERQPLIALECKKCNKKVPTWFLNHTEYLNVYFVPKEKEKP